VSREIEIMLSMQFVFVRLTASRPPTEPPDGEQELGVAVGSLGALLSELLAAESHSPIH
jgi:hypothetical protein